MRKNFLKVSALAALFLFLVAGCATAHTHSWSTNYEHNATEHWQTCAGCDETQNKGAHTFTEEVTTPATHLQEGVKTFTCSVCGYSYTETIERTSEHTFVGEYHFDDDGHWKVCECGEEGPKENHSLTEQIITPADYDNEGSKLVSCDCGYQRTEVIARLEVPAQGVEGHEISVSAALALLGESLTEAGAVSEEEYFVVGIIKSAYKSKYSDEYNVILMDENDASKTIQSYYAANGANIDTDLFKAGNRIYVGGAITFYQGKTYEFTSTGTVYKLESVSYSVSVETAEHATISALEATYPAGTEVTFSIAVDEGYQLDKVTANSKTLTASEGLYKFVVSSDTIIAYVVRITVATEDLVFPLEGKTAADLADEWTIKKYDNGWIDTSASLGIGFDYARNSALQFNYWDNYTSFRYSTNYHVSDAYQGISCDALGNGVSTFKVQLMNSTSGVYMTYNLGTIRAEWTHYELAFNDDNWKINFNGQSYTFAELKAAGYINLFDAGELATCFDMINFIFYGETSNGNSAKAYMSNLTFKAVCAASSNEPIAIKGANTVLDFSDGTGSGKYQGAGWLNRYYGNSGWTEYVPANQMNSRSKDNNKNVNMYCSTTTYQYKYEPTEPIGFAQFVSLKLANYYDGGVNISLKVSVTTVSGQTIYVLGDANNFFVLENVVGSGYQTYTKTFNAADIVCLTITTKTSNGTSYLYMDDVQILAEAPVVHYEALDINEGFDSYTSLPSFITHTPSNVYFKTDNNGDGGSKCYLSVYSKGGNQVTYTLPTAGTASEMQFAVKNTFNGAVETHVQVDIYDDNNEVVGSQQFTIAAGATWDTKTVTLNAADSVVAKVVFNFYPQGATGDTYCYIDSIVIH